MLSSLVGSEDPRFPTAESPSQGKPGDSDGRPAAACGCGHTRVYRTGSIQAGQEHGKERHSRDHQISNRSFAGGVRGQSRHDHVRRNTLENIALSFKE